ncbi:PIN domain-like protein [Atractiella rhizophila]|nr:PIN domain-like protein [Atractiella rhizophila]
MGVKGLWPYIDSRFSYETDNSKLSDIASSEYKKSGTKLRIGFDASVLLIAYRYVKASQKDISVPSIPHLVYILASIGAQAILPLIVFDGPKRPSNKRGKTVYRGFFENQKELKNWLDLLRIPHLTAAGEAEVELVNCIRHEIIDAIWTPDSDTFIHFANFSSHKSSGSAPRVPSILLRAPPAFTKSKDEPTVGVYDFPHEPHRVYDLDLELSKEELMFVAIWSGCDYYSGLEQQLLPYFSCTGRTRKVEMEDSATKRKRIARAVKISRTPVSNLCPCCSEQVQLAQNLYDTFKQWRFSSDFTTFTNDALPIWLKMQLLPVVLPLVKYRYQDDVKYFFEGLLSSERDLEGITDVLSSFCHPVKTKFEEVELKLAEQKLFQERREVNIDDLLERYDRAVEMELQRSAASSTQLPSRTDLEALLQTRFSPKVNKQVKSISLQDWLQVKRSSRDGRCGREKRPRVKK